MFFDELSWRQHKKTVFPIEDPTLSATVVNLECAPAPAVLCPETTFFIRRLPLFAALAECMEAGPQIYTPKPLYNVESMGFNRYCREGFYLYNPHQPPFSVDDFYDRVALAQRQFLDQKTPLPEELKESIMTQARPDPWTPISDLIDYNPDTEYANILIQPLVHLDKTEMARVEQIIQRGNEERNDVKIGTWKQPAPATQRDISRIIWHLLHDLWQPYKLRMKRLIFLLHRPEQDGVLDIALYLDLQQTHPGRDMYQPASLRRMTWQDGKDDLVNLEKTTYFLRHQKKLDEDLHFVDPLVFFPPTLPPKMLRDLAMSSSPHKYYTAYLNSLDENEHDFITLYLTNSGTQEQRRKLEDTLSARTMGDDSASLYIPWYKEVDGTPEDMIRFMKHLNRINCHGWLEYTSLTTVFFIDAEAVMTGHPLVASWKQYVHIHNSSLMPLQARIAIESAPQERFRPWVQRN